MSVTVSRLEGGPDLGPVLGSAGDLEHMALFTF